MSVRYSEPRVWRSSEAKQTRVEFDIVTPDWAAWESILIARREDGSIELSSRATLTDSANLSIPAVILPTVLAEIEGLVAEVTK